jgi:hypothetical protein
MFDTDFSRAARRWLARCMGAGAVVLAGCAATVQENHYFAAFRDGINGQREPVQFYRLAVNGQSQFSNTRYLTGYFDERAITLFFNELKSPTNQKLFDDATVLPGAAAGTKLVPLSPTSDNGAFVLIMSTNADAIAGTIGSFAESQVVADALTRLFNRDRINAKSQSDARLGVQKAQGTALVTQLRAHASAAASAASGVDSIAGYRRALTTLAQGLGYSGPEFDSLEKARDWFALDVSRTGSAR